jgi:hypothetical protein
MPRKDFELCVIFVNFFVFVFITGGFFGYRKIILQILRTFSNLVEARPLPDAVFVLIP